MTRMISQEKAEEKLLKAYRFFELGGIMGEKIKKINISFKEIEDPKYRSHEWFVQEKELTVRVRDQNLKSATYYLIGRMATYVIKNDERLLVRNPAIRFIMVSGHAFLSLLFMLLSKLTIGLLGLIPVAILAIGSFPYFWHKKNESDEIHYEVIRKRLKESGLIDSEEEMKLVFETNNYEVKSDIRRYLNLIIVETFYILFLIVLSFSNF